MFYPDAFSKSNVKSNFTRVTLHFEQDLLISTAYNRFLKSIYQCYFENCLLQLVIKAVFKTSQFILI